MSFKPGSQIAPVQWGRNQPGIVWVLFNFSNNCKHNILGWVLTKISQDLISNQKG